MCLCRGHVCRADDGQWGRRLRAGVEPASGLDECVRPLSGVCGCGPWRVQDSASLGGRSTCLLFTCGGKGGERGSGSEKSSGCVLDNCSDVHRLLLPSLFFIQCHCFLFNVLVAAVCRLTAELGRAAVRRAVALAKAETTLSADHSRRIRKHCMSR